MYLREEKALLDVHQKGMQERERDRESGEWWRAGVPAELYMDVYSVLRVVRSMHPVFTEPLRAAVDSGYREWIAGNNY